MMVTEFRALLHAEPFRAFTIHTTDGRAIPVKHREFALTSPSGRIVIVYQPDDSCDIIDLLAVASLSVNGEKPL